MFCPVCRAEYREGFTFCSDCQMDLVPKLEETDSESGYFLLWEGEDAVLHDSLLEVFQKENLPYVDTPLDVYRLGSANPLLLQVGPKFGFAVSVSNKDRERAIRILAQLLEIEPLETIPESLLPPHRAHISEVSATNQPWDDAAQGVEIWAGDNLRELEFLESALNGIGITSRRITEPGSPVNLVVQAEDERAAREIRRQVGESAVPPESGPEPPGSIWFDDPVQSYMPVWIIGLVDVLFGFALVMIPVQGEWMSALLGLISFVMGASQLGGYWMMYQAVRYEISPWRFVFLAFIPFAFVWYYFERYSKRRASSRLPIAVRMRMPSAR